MKVAKRTKGLPMLLPPLHRMPPPPTPRTLLERVRKGVSGLGLAARLRYPSPARPVRHGTTEGPPPRTPCFEETPPFYKKMHSANILHIPCDNALFGCTCIALTLEGDPGSKGAHRALCPRCAKSWLFSTTGSHGSQGPEFCTLPPPCWYTRDFFLSLMPARVPGS